jgi:hypothetical protein
MGVGGYELRLSPTGAGEGVFATRDFKPHETVVRGVIERRLPSNHSHATQVGCREWVLLGGLGSMVNHSCDPNCGIRTNETGAPDLVAWRFIAAGEEITFDYAMRNYVIEHFPSPCRCGARRCRGTVTGWRDLPPDRRAVYLGMVASYLLELDPAVPTRPAGL